MQKEYPLTTECSNIIAISDEAHALKAGGFQATYLKSKNHPITKSLWQQLMD